MKYTFKGIKTVKYIARFLLVACLLSLSLALFSCTDKSSDGDGEKEPPKVYLIKNGFELNGNELDSVVFSCGYRSELDVFPIEKVALSFCFGGRYDQDISKELQKHSYSGFFISVLNEKGHEAILKTYEDELVSEKYRTEWTYLPDNSGATVKYNYFESIAIPSYIFESESGSLTVYLGHEYMYLAATVIYYERVADGVVFSTEKIR